MIYKTREDTSWLVRRAFPYTCLLMTLLVVLAPALKTDMVFHPSDLLFRMPFYAECPRPTKALNPVQFDLVYGCVPNAYFSWFTAREGNLPLWNPHSLCGSPLLGTSILVSPLFPINLLAFLLPFEFGLFIRALLRFLFAGIFTYELAMSYGLRRVSALFAAVSYMLSGFMVVWQGYPHANVAAVLPAAMLAAERLCQQTNRGAQWAWTAWLGLANAVLFTAGQFQIVLWVCLLQGAYVILRGFSLARVGGGIRRLSECLVFVILAWSLGAAISAPQILPFAEWFSVSHLFEMRSSAAPEWFHRNFLKGVFALPLLGFPNLYGHPKWNMPYRPFLPWTGNYLEWAMYVGVPSVTAAVATLLAWRKSSPPARIWLAISIFCLLTIMRLPPFDWLYHLPLLRLVTKGRERVIVCLGLSLLGAFGLQSLLCGDEQTRNVVRRTWSAMLLTIFVGGLMMALTLGTLLPVFRGKIIQYGEHLAMTEYQGQNMAYHRAQVQKITDGLIRAFSPRSVSMYQPAWVALVGWLILRYAARGRRTCPRWVGYALVSLSICDLAAWAAGFNSVTPKTQFYPPTLITRLLQQDAGLFRIAARDRDFIPDAHVMYGLSDIRGIDLPTAWYARYMRLVPGLDTQAPYGFYLSNVDSPLLRVLNLKYFISAQTNELPDARLVCPPNVAGGVALWELNNVQPRSFMVYDAAVVADEDEAAACLAAEPHRVYDRVVLLAQDEPKALRYDRPPAGPLSAQVELDLYKANQSRWRITTSQNGYLVTTDAYYPGWEAYLNGQRVKLYRANLAFRSVFVPAGTHTVEYRFKPLSLTLGYGLALCGFAGVLSMLLAGTVIQRRLLRSNGK